MKDALAYRTPWSRQTGSTVADLLRQEWLFTNGLGGYASGTVSGVCTRRYHGLLVAALPAPLGRMMMFNHLIEQLRLPDGTTVPLGGDAQLEAEAGEAATLATFALELGIPVWTYKTGAFVLEK